MTLIVNRDLNYLRLRLEDHAGMLAMMISLSLALVVKAPHRIDASNLINGGLISSRAS